jgi:DNA gyrase/topoisomerase IV subunit A
MSNEETQGRVAPIDIEREMQESFLEYAMSGIVAGAGPARRAGR